MIISCLSPILFKSSFFKSHKERLIVTSILNYRKIRRKMRLLIPKTRSKFTGACYTTNVKKLSLKDEHKK